MIGNCFYYGVYSPDGYYSLTSRPVFTDNYGYVVKGYSSSVKQKLFDCIKSELDARNMDYIDFCTAEGSDGIYSPDAGFHIINGTFPDTAEPLTYGATDEIFSLSDYQDCEFLEYHSLEINDCLNERKKQIERCRRFLSASQSISNDIIRLENENIDIAKINRYTARLWQRYGGKLIGRVGTETKRFVSCITADGVELNMEAFDIFCDNIVVLVDKTGACSRIITDRLRRYALSAGYDVISCLCPMNVCAGAEHIIIPQLRFGVFVSKYYHRADFPNSRKTFAKRFLKASADQTKHRIDFSLKAYRKLMNEAFASLEAVDKCNRELDCYYMTATNMEALTNNILKKILK